MCISGVEGQYGQYPASSGYPMTLNPSATQSGQVDVSQYSQYHTMGQPVPNTHITAPQQFNIEGSVPSTVYYGNQQQPVPYSQYMSNPNYAGANSLWIKGSASWTQYATVPQGSNVQLLALSPNGGEGYISEIDPTGKINNYNYYFYPNSLLNFYADTPGRHVLSFIVAGQPSNQVTIDAFSAYKAPSTLPSYYSGYPYYWDYYPYYWDYYPYYGGHHGGEHYHGHDHGHDGGGHDHDDHH